MANNDPHQDQPYWPIVEPDTVTAWIPDGSRLANGAMGDLPGSHRLGLASRGRSLPCTGTTRWAPTSSTWSWKPAWVEVPAGAVAYHHGLTFHLAGPNTMGTVRRVHTAIYFADGLDALGEGRYPHPWSSGPASPSAPRSPAT